MGNLFDSDQTNELARLMSEQQKLKLREAIKAKLLEDVQKEEQPLNETAEPNLIEEDNSGTGRYVKTMRDLAEKDNTNRQKVVREKTDLLAGDESVTAAQLRQANQDLWMRVQTSLASLGGGGLGERDVIKLINENVPEISLDSDDLAAIIPGILDGLTTDEVPEGIINLYYTDQRVWNSITSADGIVNLSDSTGELYVNIDALIDELNGDSSFESALDSAIESFWTLKTTDSLPEGDINLYWTDARFDSAFNKAIDSALEQVFDSTSSLFDSSLFDRITLNTTDSLPEGQINLYWTDARFDSAFTEAIGGQTFDSAVDSALLEIISDSNSVILDKLTLETTDSLPEGSINLYYTKDRVDSDINAALGDGSLDSALTGIFDSDNPNFNPELWNKLTLNTTDSLPEGVENLYWTDARFDSALKENLDSAVTEILQDSSSTIYQELTLNNTDSLPEGSVNLYYTDQRVQDKIDEYVDSTFLTGQIALDDLSDVTSPSPTNNQYLQYNGAVWTPADLEIDGAILFQGVVDATVDAAPATPSNGHMYINTGSGAAVGSWTGLTNVDSDQQLIWGSDQASWFAFGGKHDPGVVEVREGVAILVADSDAARPTVSVDKATTDTWYYTKAQVDSSLTILKDSLQLITIGNDSDIAVLNNNKVDRAGDTMTGDLTLPQDPTVPLHATTKQYVDARVAELDSDIANKASATVDLTDVSDSAPVDGHLLMYNATAGEYQPVRVVEAGGAAAHHDSVAPPTPYVDGQLWFSTRTTSLYVWHVSAWVKIGL